MSRPLFSRLIPVLKQRFVTSCEESHDDENELLDQADALLEEGKAKIKVPMQFDNLKNYLNQGSVGAYDGFRVIVQKQVNLNTVVSHFYWIGSQATQNPIYQYRLILPFDEKVVNVATDMDMNIEGEVKFPISNSLFAKTNFVIGEQQTNFSLDLEHTDESSAAQVQYSSGDHAISASLMQSVTPQITLGGSGELALKSNAVSLAFGGLFYWKQYTLAAQWDNSIRLLFLSKENPNRVHLTSDLVIDEGGNSQASVSAEYTLKQSKIHMGVDSNLLLKTVFDTTVAPGVNLQFAAETQQSKGHYKYGFGVVMG